MIQGYALSCKIQNNVLIADIQGVRTEAWDLESDKEEPLWVRKR